MCLLPFPSLLHPLLSAWPGAQPLKHPGSGSRLRIYAGPSRVGQLCIGALILVGGHHGDDGGACWPYSHGRAELELGELWPQSLTPSNLDHHLRGLWSKVRSIGGLLQVTRSHKSKLGWIVPTV